jgi:hypothetical protein
VSVTRIEDGHTQRSIPDSVLGCLRLWGAVLERAILDWRQIEFGSPRKAPKRKRALLRFFHGPLFAFICQHFDIDARRARGQILADVASIPPRPAGRGAQRRIDYRAAARLYRLGLSGSQLAKRFGVTPETARRAARRGGATMRRRGNARGSMRRQAA